MSNVVLSVNNLYKSFNEGELRVDVLKGINFELQESETVAVVGASGSGKSTFLQLIGGLDNPTEGDVKIKDNSLHIMTQAQLSDFRNQHLGFIYQFHHLLAEFSAMENVAMPLLLRKFDKAAAFEQASNILSKVGLEHRLHHKPSELSGGERQRAAIARALITEPTCVLADEPTGNLDENSAMNVFGLMLDLKKTLQTSMVMVTHNLALTSDVDRVLEIHNGQLEERTS